MIKRITLLSLVLLSATLSLNGQELSSSLASRQLEDVRIRGYGVAGLLADLSLWYDVPIGMEVAMNSNGVDRLRLDFKKATLEEVLNRVVAEHPEYEWEVRDGVVHVFPKEGRQDPIVKQILGIEIGRFSIKEKTVTWDVEKTLLTSPELAPVMDGYGLTTPGWAFSGFYFPNVGSNFNLDVSNQPVRSILNRIVKESKTAKFWSISRNSQEHTLAINVEAIHEGSRKLMRKADFEDLEDSLDLIP